MNAKNFNNKENDLDNSLITKDELIINDLLELMSMSLANSNQTKSLIMNKVTAEKIWSVGSIPVGKIYDGLITIFGMVTYYAPFLPINVVGILDQNYAAGYILSVMSEDGQSVKIGREIEAVAVKGSFIYDDIQFIGLDDSDLPEWKPKFDKPKIDSKYTDIQQNEYDSSKPYSNRYDLATTVEYLEDMRKASSSRADLAYVLNRRTALDIFEIDKLPENFIHPLNQKMGGLDIVYIEHIPNGIVGLVSVDQAYNLKNLFESDPDAGVKFSVILAYNSKLGIFFHGGEMFAKLNPAK